MKKEQNRVPAMNMAGTFFFSYLRRNEEL